MTGNLSYWMLEKEVEAVCAARRVGRAVKEGVKNFFVDEEGDTNIISIVLILVIVIALAIAFRKNIAALINGIWKKIFTDAGGSVESQNMDETGDFLGK